MKKILIMLNMIMILTITLSPVSALEKSQVDNDYYIESFIKIESTTRASGTVKGSKTNNYKSNGTIMFSVTVTGTFTYDGNHAVCTNASVSASSKNANWKTTSKSASKNGNCAVGNATAKRYNNGVCVETQYCSVALSCDANGNLY